MPAKKYAKRIKRDLQEFADDQEIQRDNADRLFGTETSADVVGEFFQMIAGRVTDCMSTDDATARAFRDSGMDPQNPLHWDYLLSVFAKVHYTDNRGAPITRTDGRKAQMRRHLTLVLEKAAKLGSGKLSNTEISERMKHQFPDDYRRLKPSSIRRLLLTSS